jgi:hypothetical protein
LVLLRLEFIGGCLSTLGTFAASMKFDLCCENRKAGKSRTDIFQAATEYPRALRGMKSFSAFPGILFMAFPGGKCDPRHSY